MYLTKSIDTMLQSTPTAYVIYQLIKDSNDKIEDFKVLEYNPSYLKLIGSKDETVNNDEIKNFIFNIKKDIPEITKSIQDFKTKRVIGYSNTYKEWLSIHLFYEGDDKIIFQILDITKEKQLEHQLKLKSRELELVVNVINDLILVVDLNEKIQLANKACERTLGYAVEELIGKNIIDFLDELTYNEIISSFDDKSMFQPNTIIQTKIKRKNSKHLTIEWNCSIYDKYIYSVGRNITDLIETQEKILYLSYHDKLTGLYNRSFFEEELKRLDNDRNLPISIIMGDVNGLKITNDVFGHSKGDKLLINVANILKNAIRKGDILSRWGGDEFTILLPNTDEAATTEIIDRIYTSCKNKNIALNYASISLGYAIKKFPTQNIYETLTNAENNMYKNKVRDGKIFREKIISSMLKYLHDENHERSSSTSEMKIYLDKLSQTLNLSNEDRSKLFLLAEIHDIGLISIPKSILNKKTPLNKSDWEEIRKHPETGFRIAKSIPETSHIANNILYHQERYDGKGYPHGLKGEEIPYLNRIFSVVDVYESLRQDKSYRNSFSHEEIIDCMLNNKGSIFDPSIVDVFLDILSKEKIN